MELKIEHLSKQFKDKTAVNDVNLTLTPGIWGLLGANGAGKTTLMRMIADIMTPKLETWGISASTAIFSLPFQLVPVFSAWYSA